MYIILCMYICNVYNIVYVYILYCILYIILYNIYIMYIILYSYRSVVKNTNKLELKNCNHEQVLDFMTFPLYHSLYLGDISAVSR